MPSLQLPIRLRPTTEADLDFVLTTEQHPENRPFISQWSQEQHQAAIADPNVAHWITERVEDQHPVGYAILVGLQNPDGSLFLQRLVITHKGYGYGRATLSRLQQLAFETYQMHRFWLDVKQHNHRAQNLYRQLGFVQEGLLRDCERTSTGYESYYLMSILETEYQMIS